MPRSPKVKRLNLIIERGARALQLVVHRDLDEAAAYAMEKVAIAVIGRQLDGENGPLANFEKGGGGSAERRLRGPSPLRGRKHSQETIDKIRASHLARPPKTQEHRDKISKALTGRPLPMEVRDKLRGRVSPTRGVKRGPMSEEQKVKHRAHRHTEETKAKIAAASRAMVRPADIGQRISAAKKGKPNLKLRGRKRPQHVIDAMRAAHIGKPKSPEVRARISATKKRQAAEKKAALGQ